MSQMRWMLAVLLVVVVGLVGTAKAATQPTIVRPEKEVDGSGNEWPELVAPSGPHASTTTPPEGE